MEKDILFHSLFQNNRVYKLKKNPQINSLNKT